MEKVLIIVRGLQGSGKTSFAQLLGTKAICCTDDYLMHDGVYLWKGEYLRAAHDWCFRKCRRFMKAQAERVVVANTSPRERDLRPYMDLAEDFGYKVFSVIVENRHGGVNTHDVPEENIEKTRNRFNIQL